MEVLSGDSAQAGWLAAAEPYAEKLALEFGSERVHYGSLMAEVSALSIHFRSLGVTPGDRVAVLLNRRVDAVFCFHALMNCGATQLPLDVRLAVPELLFRIQDAGARWLIGDDSEICQALLDVCPGLVFLPTCDPDSIASVPDQHFFSQPGHLLLYTSGTSGLPKGVVLGAEQLWASADASFASMGCSSSDCWLCCLPLCHVAGISMLVRAVRCGGSVVVHPHFDPQAVNRCLDERPVTQLSLVASMLAGLLDERGRRPAPKSLRCVLVGGGPAPPDLLRRARELGFPVAPTYGMTETASQVATRAVGDSEEPLDGHLQPLPGFSVRVVGVDGNELPSGEMGEVWVRGPGLMKGYWNSHRELQGGLEDGWFRTGDLGERDAEGRLQIRTRREDLLISGGENVYPSEVELALGEHPAVEDCVVLGVPDKKWGARPVAWIRLRDGSDALVADSEWVSFLETRLARFKIPAVFNRVEDFPRTSLGKIARGRFRQEQGLED